MGDQRNSGIEWTDQTWNPLRGCSKVSQGCKHCYAETMAARFAGPGQPYEGTITNGRWNGTVKFVPEHLADPLRWKRPRRVFVNSMSDLFHESVTFETIAAIFGVMAAAPHHTFQALTKRPERAMEWLRWIGAVGDPAAGCRRLAAMAMPMAFGEDKLFSKAPVSAQWPLPNVWLGFSAEDQSTFDERWAHARKCAAKGWRTWVSLEPLLGPVDVAEAAAPRWRCGGCEVGPKEGRERYDFNDTPRCPRCDYAIGGVPELPLSWVVVGGESGPGARPMHPDWARSLRDQCAEAGVPFLFKQWGDWTPEFVEGAKVFDATYLPDGRMTPVWKVGRKVAGRLLDGALHDGYPEVAHG